MADEEAPDALRRLAAIAAARPPSATIGEIYYLRTCGWYLASTQTLVGETLHHVERRLEEVEREVWIADDGSGYLDELCDGRPSEGNGHFGPGHFRLSSSPATDQFERLTGTRTSGRSPLRALADLWSVRTVAPALQAYTLNALASEVGPASCSPLTDRLGRHGLAVAAQETVLGTTYRYVVVLSEKTGDLLATEEVALDPMEWLPYAAPCTVSYTAFITSERVPALGMRPGPGR